MCVVFSDVRVLLLVYIYTSFIGLKYWYGCHGRHTILLYRYRMAM